MIDGSLFGEQNRCFGCSPTHPFGFHLRGEETDEGVVASMTPGEQYQGPPGIMHGGLVATLADEVAAWALIVKHGKFGFTTEMTSRYRRAVRIAVETEARAKVVADRRRFAEVEVLISQEGQLCYEGKVTFVLLDKSGVEKLLGGPLPEAWKRFAR